LQSYSQWHSDLDQLEMYLCDFRFPPRCKWDSSLFWDVTQCDWYLVTEVSGQPIGFILKGEVWLLKMGPLGCRRTSVT